jgi:hypothetical protein
MTPMVANVREPNALLCPGNLRALKTTQLRFQKKSECYHSIGVECEKLHDHFYTNFMVPLHFFYGAFMTLQRGSRILSSA